MLDKNEWFIWALNESCSHIIYEPKMLSDELLRVPPDEEVILNLEPVLDGSETGEANKDELPNV